MTLVIVLIVVIVVTQQYHSANEEIKGVAIVKKTIFLSFKVKNQPLEIPYSTKPVNNYVSVVLITGHCSVLHYSLFSCESKHYYQYSYHTPTQ